MAARSSLTVEQRQQIIRKLLEERRRSRQETAGDQAAPLVDDAERRQRVQELIRERSLSKLTSSNGGYGSSAAMQYDSGARDELLSPGSSAKSDQHNHGSMSARSAGAASILTNAAPQLALRHQQQPQQPSRPYQPPVQPQHSYDSLRASYEPGPAEPTEFEESEAGGSSVAAAEGNESFPTAMEVTGLWSQASSATVSDGYDHDAAAAADHLESDEEQPRQYQQQYHQPQQQQERPQQQQERPPQQQEQRQQQQQEEEEEEIEEEEEAAYSEQGDSWRDQGSSASVSVSAYEEADSGRTWEAPQQGRQQQQQQQQGGYTKHSHGVADRHAAATLRRPKTSTSDESTPTAYKDFKAWQQRHQQQLAPQQQRPQPDTTWLAHHHHQQQQQQQPANRHSKQAAMHREGERAYNEMPFVPATNCDQHQQQQQQRSPRAGGKGRHAAPVSGEERIQQLAQPRSLNLQKYEQIKKEQEAAVLQHCSFAPKTGRAPEHRAAPTNQPVTERLYHAHDDRRRRLERKRAEQEAAALAQCTFAPSLTSRQLRDDVGHRPIHQRVGDLLRRRNEALTKVRLAAEDEGGEATFAPAINPRSVRMASAARQNKERAVQGRACEDDTARDRDGGKRTPRQAMRRCRSEADLLPSDAAERCTFTPAINASTERLLQGADIPTSFHERQKHFDRLAREKRAALAAAAEDGECSFSPALISTADTALAGSRHYELLGESYLERIERLAFKDKERADASRSAMAEHYHNTTCTFTPAINPVSRRMAKPTPVQELYENKRGKQRRAAVARAVEAAQAEECSFAPDLTKPNSSMAGGAPAEARLSISGEDAEEVVQRLQRFEHSKQQRIEAASHLREYDELKECTFAPAIQRSSVPDNKGPVRIRGLGRFMELQAMARKQKEEQAAIEAKVFHTCPRSPKQLFTVPQPFQLTYADESRSSFRRAAAHAEAAQAALRECTFRPQTSARDTRALIERILLETDDDL